MFNILITGAYGQLGSEIKEVSYLRPETHFVFHDIDTLDITKPDLLKKFFSSNSFDFIVNCAGYTNVDDAEKDRETACLVNETAAGYLAEFAEKKGCRLIHISTDYVFDGRQDRPYSEDDKPNPVSVYGRSKLAGEKLVLQYGNNMVIRTSWLYSSFGNNFVKKMASLSMEKDDLRIVNDQIGSPTYAFDLASAILDIAEITWENNDLFVPGIYHYANSGACSWYDLTREIVRLTGASCRVTPIKTEEYPLPARRPAYSVLQTGKIKSHFGIQIPHWKESLSVCINKIQQNQSGNGEQKPHANC
ncbi:MAG: dTDP-4-dehydrorhamnose reductase [Bacteroidales bacterium]|nr:MAG: dTDP-4-dehydrorhamnose reductase [Bacteroidales bacterium]